MARKAREKSPVGIYTVRLKSTIYSFTKEDHDLFLRALTSYQGYEVLSYFLSMNTLIFVLKEDELSLEQIMRKITVRFVSAYKKKHQIETAVFQDRYVSYAATSLEDAYGMLGRVNELRKKEEQMEFFTFPKKENDPYISHKFFEEHFSSYEEYEEKCCKQDTKQMAKRFSDDELKDFLRLVYKVEDAHDLKKMPQNVVIEIISGILKFTSVSARQIARITTLPVRWLWKVTSQLKKPDWSKKEKQVKKEIKNEKEKEHIQRTA